MEVRCCLPMEVRCPLPMEVRCLPMEVRRSTSLRQVDCYSPWYKSYVDKLTGFERFVPRNGTMVRTRGTYAPLAMPMEVRRSISLRQVVWCSPRYSSYVDQLTDFEPFLRTYCTYKRYVRKHTHL
jgi:hypothetical protein